MPKVVLETEMTQSVIIWCFIYCVSSLVGCYNIKSYESTLKETKGRIPWWHLCRFRHLSAPSPTVLSSPLYQSLMPAHIKKKRVTGKLQFSAFFQTAVLVICSTQIHVFHTHFMLVEELYVNCDVIRLDGMLRIELSLGFADPAVETRTRLQVSLQMWLVSVQIVQPEKTPSLVHSFRPVAGKPDVMLKEGLTCCWSVSGCVSSGLTAGSHTRRTARGWWCTCNGPDPSVRYTAGVYSNQPAVNSANPVSAPNHCAYSGFGEKARINLYRVNCTVLILHKGLVVVFLMFPF